MNLSRILVVGLDVFLACFGGGRVLVGDVFWCRTCFGAGLRLTSSTMRGAEEGPDFSSERLGT
jgi:hypothetical protein